MPRHRQDRGGSRNTRSSGTRPRGQSARHGLRSTAPSLSLAAPSRRFHATGRDRDKGMGLTSGRPLRRGAHGDENPLRQLGTNYIDVCVKDPSKIAKPGDVGPCQSIGGRSETPSDLVDDAARSGSGSAVAHNTRRSWRHGIGETSSTRRDAGGPEQPRVRQWRRDVRGVSASRVDG